MSSEKPPCLQLYDDATLFFYSFYLAEGGDTCVWVCLHFGKSREIMNKVDIQLKGTKFQSTEKKE